MEHFRRTVALPVERYRDPSVTERLSHSVRPFLLRKKKADPNIAPDLPPRIVTDQPVPLTSEQATLYEAEVREALDAIEKPGHRRRPPTADRHRRAVVPLPVHRYHVGP